MLLQISKTDGAIWSIRGLVNNEGYRAEGVK